MILRCVQCGRPVPADVGGAFCALCRPVDLTRGVWPCDAVQPKRRAPFVAARKRCDTDERREWWIMACAGFSAAEIADERAVPLARVQWHLTSMRRRGVAA